MNFTAERIEKQKGDLFFMGLLILLVGIGLAVLFSASSYIGETRFDDSFYFLKRQGVLVAFGALLAFFVSRIPLDGLRRGIPVLVLLSFILTGMTFVPGIGETVLGARRWIFLFGFSFQPSELVKVTVILYLAHIFSKKEDHIDDFVKTVLPPLTICGLFVLLVYLQNDFSTAFFIFTILLIMFFIARVRLVYFITLATIGIPLATILLFTKEHRVQRIIAFLDPQNNPDASYQVNAARTALMNGGLWGSGLGEGSKKLGGLPEAHSDFIFAVLGEEMGLLGIVFVIAAFIAFAFRGYTVASRSKERFGYYVAFGCTTTILYQAMLNFAVVSGLLPATGIPLPFFSSGGSSIIITLIMCGLIINVSRHASDEVDHE